MIITGNFNVTVWIPLGSSQGMYRYRNVISEFYRNSNKATCFLYIDVVINTSDIEFNIITIKY